MCKTWKEYSDDLDNVDTEKQVTINMYVMKGLERYSFQRKYLSLTEIEARVKKVQSGKAGGK